MLTPEQEQRLRDIRTVLDQQMATRGSSAPKPAPTRPAPAGPGPKPMTESNALSAFQNEEPRGDPNAFKVNMGEDLSGDLEAAAERADAALKATKTRPRAKNSDEAVAQLNDIDSQYTPSESGGLHMDEYFGY